VGRGRVREFRKEREKWVDFVRFEVWAILKAVANGAGREGVRSVVERTRLSPLTVEKVLNRLVRYRIIEERKEKRWPYRRSFRLTERGEWLLACFDSIGELVKQIREEEVRASPQHPLD
jgi:DNA-binding IclR family transcriptional regulator